jgi:hypothetical protein
MDDGTTPFVGEFAHALGLFERSGIVKCLAGKHRELCLLQSLQACIFEVWVSCWS